MPTKQGYLYLITAMKTKRLTGPIVLTIIASLLSISTAQAIPAFARNHQAECTVCHTAWPALNATGRSFKESGYRFSRDPKPEFLGWDKTMPIAVILKSRPYEKADNGNKTLRALHEVELMIAGPMAQGFSGFFEIEAEDDSGGGFELELPVAAIGYHPSEAINVQVSWGPIGWSDPYDVYSNARKMTRNRAAVIDQAFGGADNNGKLRSARQNITVYGRPQEQLFYSLGISGVAGDPKGEDSDVINARLAVDINPNIMIGLSAMNGNCINGSVTPTNCLVKRNFSRTGIDVQADIDSLRIMAAFLQAKDDNLTPTTEAENTAMYIEGRYVFQKNGRPTFVPLLRLDSYEENDGQDNYDEVTLQLGYYFAENIRGFIEYWDQSAATGDDNKITLQLDLGF